MRALTIVLGSVAAVLLGSALLAPWLFWLAQGFAGVLPDKAVYGPFHQYILRSMLICAVIGIFIIRHAAFDSWQQLGLKPPQEHWRQFLIGMFWTMLLMSLLAAIIVIAGGRRLNADIGAAKMLARFGTALATAITIAFLEELLFRGALFGGLRRMWSLPAALLVSSMIYAIVHFPHRTGVITDVSWYTGFLVLPTVLSGFIDIKQVMPGFLFLTAAGMIFALAYHRTGALYSAMGLHAGAIIVIKLYGSVTTAGADPWLWGTDKLTDGWFGLAYILVLLAVFPRLPLGQVSPPAKPAKITAADPALAPTSGANR